MRLYGKRFIGRNVERRISSRAETKDAIVWDVLPLQHVARVKIQGSSTLIIAKYPQGWVQTPEWLKPGNVVKVNFTGGNRSRCELFGQGYLRPTQYDGTASTPTPTAAPDDVLTGGYIYPIPLQPRMAVYVKTGTYRIDGTTYVLGPMTLADDNNALVGDGLPLDYTAAVINIDSVAAGYYRYDLFCVGTDGTVDYVKGTAVAAGTEPTLPALPADHVQLGRVFVYPGLTAITANELSSYYVAPKVTYLTVTSSPDHLHLSDTYDKLLTITAVTKDHYGNTVTLSGPLRFSFQIFAGNCTLYTADGESTSERRTKIYSEVTSGSSAQCFYLTDSSPTGETAQSIIVMAQLEDQTSDIFGIVTIEIENP